jgi:hypothetical protein
MGKVRRPRKAQVKDVVTMTDYHAVTKSSEGLLSRVCGNVPRIEKQKNKKHKINDP